MEAFIYSLSNAFRIYVLSQLTTRLLRCEPKRKNIALFAYIAYFLLNSGCFLFSNNQYLNLASNLLPYFCITFLYPVKLLKKGIVSVAVYAIQMFCDGIMYSVNRTFFFDHIFIGSGTATALMIYCVYLVMKRRDFSGENSFVKNGYLIAALIIPLGSIIIALLMFDSYNVRMVVSSAFLLLLNILIFYMYDAIQKYYIEQNERDRVEQQMYAYQAQLKNMYESQTKISCLKHDLDKHLYHLHFLLDTQQYDKAMEYIDSEQECTQTANLIVSTGNSEIDSLLNYKLGETMRSGAELTTKINLPAAIGISNFDLIVILGNLLDNAIEGLNKSDFHELFVSIHYHTDILYIEVSNSCAEGCCVSNMTTKHDKALHGFGLKSVQAAVKKYNGIVRREIADGKYTVSVMLYNSAMQ